MIELIIKHSGVITSTLTTLMAAFFGAWFAFRFQESKNKKLELKGKKAALNKALFIIFRQFNELMFIKNKIDQCRNIPIRAFSMPANISSNNNIVLNDHELSFLLETDQPDLLFKLLVEHDRFKQAIVAYDMRTKLHINEIQPALEKYNLIDRNVSLEEFQDKLGQRLFISAVKITDSLFQHIDETIISHEEFGKVLFDFSKKMFPKDSFIQFEPKT